MFQPQPLPRKYEACLRDLASTKAAVRASAVTDVVRHATGDSALRAAVVPLLERALSDEVAGVRSAAAVALADLGAASAVPLLLAAIEDDDAHVRQMAISALGEIGEPLAAARLSRALSDSRPEVRYQSIIAFVRVCRDQDEVAAALVRAAGDDDFNIRYIALRLAEEHGITGGGVLERAAKSLSDAASEVRAAAAILLAKSGDARGHGLVLAIVRGDVSVQKEDEREAVELAGAENLAAAVPALERRAFGLAAKVSDTCSFHAIVALARMGHPRAVASIDADLRASSARRRQAGVVAAGRAKLASMRALIASATDVDAQLRDEALASIGA